MWIKSGSPYRNKKNNRMVIDVECSCGVKSTVEEYKFRNHKTSSCRACATSRNNFIRRLPPEEYAVNRVWEYYKKSALARNLSFELTKEDFASFLFKNCKYCGVPPANKIGRRIDGEAPVSYNGLDRIDPGEGYKIDNVVTCCGQCNDAKGVMTREEFKSWLTRVVAYSLGEVSR